MLKEIVRFITVEPEINASALEVYRFPYVASLFFCAQFSEVVRMVFEYSELFQQLVEFLVSREERLPVLAGYFCKACEAIMGVNCYKFLQDFFYLDGHLALVDHIGSSSLSDLLGKVMTNCCKFEDFSGNFIDISLLVIEKLSPIQEYQVSYNAATVIAKFVFNQRTETSSLFISRFLRPESNTRVPEVNLQYFFVGSAECIGRVYSNLRSGNEQAINSGLRVILAILQRFNTENNPDISNFIEFFTHFSENIECFTEILERNSEKVGKEKLAIVDVIREGINVNYSKINESIMRSGVLIILTEVFQKFPFCSIFHNAYLSLILTILSTTHNNLLLYAFYVIKLQEIIVKHSEFPTIQTKNCRIRKGFMGHLHSIANKILSLEDQHTFIEDLIENTQGWYIFERTSLLSQNLIESKRLGGEETEYLLDKLSSDDESISVVNIEKICESEQNEEKNYGGAVFWKIPVDFSGIQDL